MVDEKTREKNYNLVSYWALAYNCIVLDKILIYVSIAALIFLGVCNVEDALLLALKCSSIMAFLSTLILSLILIKLNNEIIEKSLNDFNIKTCIDIIDKINLVCCLIGIFVLGLFILIK